LAVALPVILKEVVKVLRAVPGDQKEDFIEKNIIPIFEGIGAKIAGLLLK